VRTRRLRPGPAAPGTRRPGTGRSGTGLPGAGLLGVALLTGCAAAAGSGSPAAGPGPQAAVRGTVTVFAAASLTDAFGTLGEQFEAEHPDVTVTFSFGASSGLAQQVLAGAPVDVFAAASPATMATVTDADDDAAEPQVFARNRLAIAVPPDDPGRVRGLADFARPELLLALCAPEVPCGAAAAEVFAAAGITPAPDTLEQDVRAALSKVALGEVDAALVYRTDVLAAGADVRGIAFPEADSAVNDYPVVTLEDAPNPVAAQAFVAHVLSSEGQQVLADAGFDSP
jgi:molybdate transport system substrate-binding protein